MTDTRWRIAGGIGVPPSEPDEQVMTQGLGFPLRPVDGVPPVDSGEIYEMLPIAEGLFAQWHGEYQTGLIYPRGSMVRDGDWLMCSNKATLQKPAPVPTGDNTWSLPDTPAFLTESETAVVHTGHDYTFLESGWVKGLRVWVTELTAETNYRIIVSDITDPNKIKTTIFEEPVLAENDWQIIALVDRLVLAGTRWIVILDSLNSGGDSIVTGGWTHSGQENTLPPPVSSWNHNTQQTTVRVSSTDLDVTDRHTELMGITIDSDILFAETLRPERSVDYRVVAAPIDYTTYVEYTVELKSIGGGGTPDVSAATTMTATIPIPQPTQYVELAASVPTPTWATVTGYKAYNGVDQGGAANSYGVDLNFDSAEVSPDWDVMSVGT